MNYYNEFEPHAAAWLRELIKQGHIPAGDVDERSIEDVTPNELRGYTQHHFFAGIGGWSHALDLAGWPRDRPVWTGSCPCQPFSAAGKGAGFEDERHLWPAWQHLIAQCRPAAIFGEQVASKAVDSWIDLVHADMEGMGYAFGSVPFPAAGVGAPHIRDRNYWMGHANDAGLEGHAGHGRAAGRQGQERPVAAPGLFSGLAHADSRQRDGFSVMRGDERIGEDAGRAQSFRGAAACSVDGGPAHAGRQRICSGGYGPAGSEASRVQGADGERERIWIDDRTGSTVATDTRPASPLHGFWRDSDWLGCRDGKWRPVEPASQCMANGLSLAMGRLCADHEKEIADAQASDGFAGKVLRALQQGNSAETIWRAIGGRHGVSQATILLAVMCKHSGELGRIFNGDAQGGPQVRECSMQPLREIWPESRSPQGQEPTKQPADELGNTVSKLSQNSASFRELVTSLAGFNGSPLAHGLPARVGLLRGYGNAIVPQAAAEFVAAYLQATGLAQMST